MEATWTSDSGSVKEEATDDGDGNDAEGVWSADIEQSFQEALAIYPPCGRRKIILSDEGKMYGRNELIARYIKLRTGKTRTRKQVSSHIQVLARRKTKEVQSTIKDPGNKEKAMQTLSQLSSAQIVSASALHNRNLGEILAVTPHHHHHLQQEPGLHHSQQPRVGHVPAAPVSAQSHAAAAAGAAFWAQQHQPQPASAAPAHVHGTAGSWSLPPDVVIPAWHDRSIAGPKLRLVELTAYVESSSGTGSDGGPDGSGGLGLSPTDNNNLAGHSIVHRHSHTHVFAHISQHSTYADPVLEAVDISQIADKFPDKKEGLRELYDRGPKSAFFLVKFWADINTSLSEDASYGATTVYESSDNFPIKCSTKVCSFGKQVVEKIDNDVNPQYENGKFVYRVERSPMCDYMINFITKLRQLPEKYMMNSVLENFTILQLVTNQDTNETLLCICYAFEVSSSEHGAQHHIYRLVAN